MKVRFKAEIVVEAGDGEDALRKIGARLATITTHIAQGESLASCRAFFQLTKAPDDTEADDLSDPIVEANGAYPQPEPEPEGVDEPEKVNLTQADVGRVEDVIGDPK